MWNSILNSDNCIATAFHSRPFSHSFWLFCSFFHECHRLILILNSSVRMLSGNSTSHDYIEHYVITYNLNIRGKTMKIDINSTNSFRISSFVHLKCFVCFVYCWMTLFLTILLSFKYFRMRFLFFLFPLEVYTMLLKVLDYFPIFFAYLMLIWNSFVTFVDELNQNYVKFKLTENILLQK